MIKQQNKQDGIGMSPLFPIFLGDDDEPIRLETLSYFPFCLSVQGGLGDP